MKRLSILLALSLLLVQGAALARKSCVKLANERMSSATFTVELENTCKDSPAKCWVDFDIRRPNGMMKNEKIGPKDINPRGKATYDTMIFSDSKVTYKWGCLDPKEFENAATEPTKLTDEQKEMRPTTMDTDQMMDDSALLDD